MTAAKKLEPVSVADYLAGELVSPVEHEYVGGMVYAMASGKVLHHRIATNITGAIAARLRGKRCEGFNSDMKVRVPPPPRERFYYPDASIVCRTNPPEDSYQGEPVVIFEVLSKGRNGSKRVKSSTPICRSPRWRSMPSSSRNLRW